MLPSLPTALITEILAAPPAFHDSGQQEACERLVDELSEEDQEVAAETSYAYWVASVSDKDCLSPDVRKRMVLKEALRHYVGEGQDYDKALISLQGAIDYRKEYKTNLFRTCLLDDFPYDNEEDAKLAAHYRQLIESDLPKQFIVIRGKDKEDHPIVLVSTRSTPDTDDEAYVMTRLHAVERVVAVAETVSRGKLEKVVTVLDFGDYKSGHSPPYNAIKQVVVLLQRKYPERLKRLIILDPPLWMRGLFFVIRPFLDPDTREKVFLVRGLDKKIEMFSGMIDKEQATSTLLPDGELTAPVDIQRYMHSVPFHCLYDDDGSQSQPTAQG
eukprot:CAMPEP_0116828324 /NCGR_PEP_ID=MMETSP0418-20121206/3595_1 /TAXON_ID=1158023 /ORGANISM="Astrosyne radiata, Strain 13vi08-1A" /LENGTH=327 /DNA_ID=CAMNT_0004457205 /DNA_START=158 /DNA_END=1141 /DNA_ORIENTATION=-